MAQQRDDSGITNALSASEREELRTRGTRLLLVLVLVLLAGALLLPRVAQRRIDRLRDEINLVAEPARARAAEIQLDLALEAAARRGILLTGDLQLERDLERSRRRRVAAEGELAAHARQLDPPVRRRVGELAVRLHGLDSLLDTARLAARRAGGDESLLQHQAQFDAALASADTLRDAILRSEEERRARIGATERSVAILTAVLLLLGLGASALVARLGGRFHALALRLQENELQIQHSAAGERTARAAAEQRRVDLERVTESRTRLIRGFTHDVKNPLGAADGYLALLEEGIMGPLAPRQAEAITKVRRSIGQALALIADLLDLDRAEAGQLVIHPRPTDAAQLVREVADSYRAAAAAKGLEISVEPDPALPAVHTDPVRARQVLGNLVSNAVKYTPAGGHITVRTCPGRAGDARGDGDERRARWVVLSVTDDGPGIPSDRVPRLFEEFTRFDPGAADGAGVGLAIAQRIAEALGGSITVDTVVGRGSTFALRLPVQVSPIARPGAAP
ncbi:MAG TPA: HAMP domain-containing sensor histidine kinase [Gemmatimonadaceae bacterium]